MLVQVISEKMLRQAAEDLVSDGETNSFIYALERGKVFKDHDLSPLYLLDKDTNSIYVTSKQYVKKMFH